MATGNRGGNRSGNRGRSGRNNNPEGRNQYSGWMSGARERPLATAAAVGGAVAAGVFLWSRRNQISEQIAGLSEQLGEWREGLGSSEQTSEDDGETESFMARPSRRTGRRNQAELAEEALTLKETGKSNKRGADTLIEDEVTTAANAR